MYHLRFTPYDLSGYEWLWLDRYTRYIVAEEEYDDDGNALLHYHILIDTDAHKDTVRDMVKKKLPIPPSGKGKNNKYYALIADWKDPGYICKYNKVVHVKGYTEKEIMEFVINGKKKYLDKVDKSRTELSGEEAPAAERSAKPKRVKVPYQQEIIAIATAEWWKLKRQAKEEGTEPNPNDVTDLVVKAMREVSRGINVYLVQDCTLAVLYDDTDYRERVLSKIKSKLSLYI